MQSKRIVAVLTVCVLSVLVISGISEVSATIAPPSDLNNGPYVDNIVYTVMSLQDERILALQAGTIEMDTSAFDSDHYDALSADPDINIYNTTRNGYGSIIINCRDYPLNISGLRRAFAYAYDKTKVRTDIFDGFSRDHDSIVPYPNGWCVEDDFDWHYYASEVAIGNAILDELNFVIDVGTGFRLAPNGSAFNITIEYTESSPEIAGEVAQLGVDALTALHIDATAVPVYFSGMVSRLDNHEDYDMVFLPAVYWSNNVDWLAYEYWSGYADLNCQNPSNFANDTYDGWRDQLLYDTAYEDVDEASAAMQEILHYNVPRLVVYENIYSQAYRNDQFTDHVEDIGRSISGPWTMRKIRSLDGMLGGSVPVAIAQGPLTFNFFVSSTPYSSVIFSNLYSSLYSYGPDLLPWPDLAVDMLVETHSDNVAVPTGHTRYTIDIVQNATWTNGLPLTAADVAFSFNYYQASVVYGNPYGAHLDNLVSSTAPLDYRVVLEFDIESYWVFSEFAYKFIIPESVFNDATGIGSDSWASWSAPHATSGPFYVSGYDYGDWYKITKDPEFYYPAKNPTPIITTVDDFSYVVGTIGNTIVWKAVDDNPSTYVVMKDLDNTPVTSGVWDGTNITVNVDGLAIGSYKYELTLFDDSSNEVSDSVWVTVVQNTNTDPFNISDMLLIGIAGGSVVVIAIVGAIIYKKKR